jgi:RNA 2',3'-cyclic 3'-phosphodiesterase
VVPPGAAIDHLDRAIESVREGSLALRWSKSSMWHLTLAFFGAVAEERIPRLEERLARVAIKYETLELRFRGAGAFSRPARANVLYIGVDTALEPIAALAASCGAAGRRVGLDVEDRPYRPHLTAARAQGREPVDVRSVVEELADYVGPRWTASGIALVRSNLGAEPTYETLATWPLRASAS